jgi:hypothetical protein
MSAEFNEKKKRESKGRESLRRGILGAIQWQP